MRRSGPRRALLLCTGVLVFALVTDTEAQAPLPGGRIVGRVIDATSASPLPGTIVQLSAPARQTVSGSNGEFVLDGVPTGERRVQAERLGYRSIEVTVSVQAGQTSDVQLNLVATPLRLSGVVVTGTVHARERDDVLSPTALVSGTELERHLGATVAATLSDQPGMASASIGPATARPVIRGLGGDRILILEDGQRPGDLSSTSGDHAVAVEAGTAQRFEVVRGPMSLLYGSSALGGVVNVVREEIPQRPQAGFHGLASLQGESASRGVSAAGVASTGHGPWAARFEGSFRDAGDIRTPLGDLQNTESRAWGGAAGLANLSSTGHVGAAYRFYANHYGIPGGFAGGHATGVNIEMRRHSLRAEAGLHDPVGPFSTLDANVGYTDYHHAEFETSGSVGTRFNQRMFFADAVAHHESLGPLTHGAIGARLQLRGITTGGSLRTPSTDDRGLAIYAVEEAAAGAFRFQLGARYDHARYVPQDTTASIFVGGRRIPIRPRTFGSVSGSAGLLWAPAEPLRFGASVSRAYRTPDFNELYSDGPHLAANSYDVGDPELSDETGTGIDLFARLSSDRINAEVAVFRNELTDYVFPSSRGRAELGSQGNRPRFQYTNENALFTGAEADAEWMALRNIVLHASASFVQARFTSERAPIPVFDGVDTTYVEASRYPPFIPPLHGVAGARYERPDVFGGVEVHWAAEARRLGDFEEPTAAHGTVNLDVGYRFNWLGRLHSVTLAVRNAADTEYRNHLSRTKTIMPEAGRNVSLLYRVTF